MVIRQIVDRVSIFYVVMTHHTAKANLEKCSSWPPEAFLEVTHYPKLILMTQLTIFTCVPQPGGCIGANSPLPSDY